MRVYVPSTIAGLSQLEGRGGLGAPPVFGSAVTDDLRVTYADADEDELDFAALDAAAHESLRLLAAQPDLARRRVVIATAVDAAAVRVDPAAGLAAVLVSTEILVRDVIALYLDDTAPAAEHAVRAAASALDSADRGDDAARAVVDTLDDYQLLWYGTQELPHVLGR